MLMPQDTYDEIPMMRRVFAGLAATLSLIPIFVVFVWMPYEALRAEVSFPENILVLIAGFSGYIGAFGMAWCSECDSLPHHVVHHIFRHLRAPRQVM